MVFPRSIFVLVGGGSRVSVGTTDVSFLEDTVVFCLALTIELFTLMFILVHEENAQLAYLRGDKKPTQHHPGRRYSGLHQSSPKPFHPHTNPQSMSFAPAIDFRELRRQERTRAAAAAASHTKGNSGGRRTADAPASSSASLPSSSPLQRLFPHQTKETHSLSPGEADQSVVASPSQLPPWTFAPSTNITATTLSKLAPVCDNPPLLRYQDTFLPSDYRIALEEWLFRLPHLDYFDAQQQHSENRGWVSLPHAKRQVAVFATAETVNDKSKFRENPAFSSSSKIAALEPLLSMVTPLFPLSHPPNHILVNRYSNVDEVGILPHTDGPAYYPLTCTISLGASVFLTFTQSSPPSVASSRSTGTRATTTPARSSLPSNIRVRLSGCGSLVVFSEDLYSDYLHSIDPTDQMHTDAGSDRESDSDAGFDVRAEVHPKPFNRTAVPRRDRLSITIRHKYK